MNITMNKFYNETTFVFSNEFTGFTTIPNTILNDKRLSYKALGIYCQILQFQNSPNHKLYQKTLVKLKKDGRESISSGIKELIELGYLKKEQLKNENGKFYGVKYTVFLNPKQNNFDEKTDNINCSSENGKSEFGKKDIGKPAPKKTMGNQENMETYNNIVSQSLMGSNTNKNEQEEEEESPLKALMKRINQEQEEQKRKELNNINIKEKNIERKNNNNNNYIKNKESFKIELEDNKDELNKIIVDIANNLITNQKTVNVSNENISVNKIVEELKKLKNIQIQKLIDYVSNKFKTCNKVIRNQTKYITSIFVNAIFEKSYLIESFQEGNSFYLSKNNDQNINQQPKRDNFVNYKQPSWDFKKLREYELKSLRDEI